MEQVQTPPAEHSRFFELKNLGALVQGVRKARTDSTLYNQ